MGKRVQRPGPERTGMITEGNDHLGRSLFAFTIPAVMTCPGMTLACTIACYALNFLFMVKKNLDRHERIFKRAQRAPDQFAKDLILEIRFKRVKVLRIHVAGDFFSVAYVRAWLRIARACRGVTFLFYTRSWRVPDLVPHLVALASLPNVYAWWSEDRDSGRCDLPVGRRCYLCVDRGDEDSVPPDVDLVFRDDTRVPRKWIGLVWVCPKEQGVKHGLTCSTCRRCFQPAPLPRRRREGIPPSQRRTAETYGSGLDSFPAPFGHPS